MIGYVNLALMDVPEWSTTQKNLQEVLVAANRAKELVRQILTFGREGAEQRKRIHIAPVIRESLRAIQALLPGGITVSDHITDVPSTIMANATQIHQILLNLCTNAAHAMKDRGGILDIALKDIDIEAEMAIDGVDVPPGSYVELSVSDTGCGMSRNTLSHIFEPFFTTKQVGEGTHGACRSPRDREEARCRHRRDQ